MVAWVGRRTADFLIVVVVVPNGNTVVVVVDVVVVVATGFGRRITGTKLTGKKCNSASN